MSSYSPESRLPPLGASALRQAVLASAASQTTYDRRTQDLLDKVGDVLSFGASGIRRPGASSGEGGANGSSSSSASVGGGSNMPTHTTTSVLDGKRKQVTALKMDPPSSFDDLREPPRAVKQQILAQLAKKNKKKRLQQQQQQQQQQQHQASGSSLSSFLKQQTQGGGGGGAGMNVDEDDDDDDDDDDEDYEKKRDKEKRQNQQAMDREEEDLTAQSAVFLDSKKAAAAAAKPIPYYLRKGNRNAHISNSHGNTNNNINSNAGGDGSTLNNNNSGGGGGGDSTFRAREIVIALGSDRMDAKELQRVIEHEYAVRMCEQLGISPSTSNIARIHRRLPLSDCSVTQVMHPGLARGERRNCISIVPKFVKEQEERKLADLRGERNALWNRANLKKKEDLNEDEMMALLKAEEVSKTKRRAAATISAHLQHMPSGTTTAGIIGSGGSSNKDNGIDSNNENGNAAANVNRNDLNARNANNNNTMIMSSNNNNNFTNNAFDDIKNRFVFPFNEPVRNSMKQSDFPQQLQRPKSSSRKNSPSNNNNTRLNTANSGEIILEKRRKPAVPLGRQKNDTSNAAQNNEDFVFAKNINHHNSHDNINETKQDEIHFQANVGGGQDRTDARLSMQDKLIQQQLIAKEKERRQHQKQADDETRKQRATLYGHYGAFSNTDGANQHQNDTGQQQDGKKFKNNINSNNSEIDPKKMKQQEDLQKLLSEADVVRLSEAQLERLKEQRIANSININNNNKNNNNNEYQEYDSNNHPGGDEDDNESISMHAVRATNDAETDEFYNKNKNSGETPPRNQNNNSNFNKKAHFANNNNNNNNNNKNNDGDDDDDDDAADDNTLYHQQQHLVPSHVITECAGVPNVPARIDLDEIRRQFLRNVPIGDVFGPALGPLLKAAVLSEPLLRAQEATIEFFSEVCFLGPVKRRELLRENGQWLARHVSSTSIDLQFSKMYEYCTKLLRDRANTASVSKVVTRSAVLFLVLRVTIRAYFVRRSPGLVAFDAGNQLLGDIDSIFCAAIDPGCLYSRVPQLESMPQALRVLHAKRVTRTGRRHALNPKAVSAKLQFVLGDSRVLRRFQALGSKSYEPVVLIKKNNKPNTTTATTASATKQAEQNREFGIGGKKSNKSNKKTHRSEDDDDDGDREQEEEYDLDFKQAGENDYENDEQSLRELSDQADLLAHFLQRKKPLNNNNNEQSHACFPGSSLHYHNERTTTSSTYDANGGLDFGNDCYNDKNTGGPNKPPVEQTQKHITRGLAYLRRILSPNVKTLLLDLTV